MQHIVKKYGELVANDDVSFGLNKGEILALVGENGAGKSTIMKVLYGLEKPDAGQVLLNGQPVAFHGPTDAIKHGIGMVQQHFMLFGSMTVTENIVYSNVPKKHGVFMDMRGARKTVQALCARYKLDVPPDAVAQDCPVGLQQRVEILKILYQNADIIIFDEPSAVLTPLEVEDLLATMKSMAQDGKSIILITHKLAEVMEVADRVVVMRGGKVVGQRSKDETSVEELSFMMVGRQIPPKVIPPPRLGSRLLSVEDLCLERDAKQVLQSVSLHVDEGEIVGIAGISGNGQSELVNCIFGLMAPGAGRVVLNGRDMAGRPVNEMRRAGMALIPEDRYHTGSTREGTLQENVLMGSEAARPYASHGVLSWKAIQGHAAQLLQRYDVRSAGTLQMLGELSGGNAQKLIVARELSRETPLLIASEPTRGVDIGAIEFIHDKLLEKRNSGGGVLLISSELSEINALCDRIYVIHNGAINGEFERGRVDDVELGLLMVGGKRHAG